MSASSISGKSFGRRATMLILGAIIACVGAFAFAGPAKADPFSMDLDNGQINLGFAFKGAKILPAPQTLPGSDPPVTLPNLWQARDTTEFANPTDAAGFGCLTPVKFNFANSPPTPTATPNPTFPCGPNPAAGTVSGDNTAGALTVAGTPVTGPPNQWGLPNGLRFPIMIVPNPLDNSPVPITIATSAPITGNFNAATGEVNLNGSFEARVLTGLASNPLGEYCSVALEGLALSTNSNADFPGVPFTNGINGQGALTGTYNITQDAVSVGGADCATVNQVSKGAGSIWLSNGIAEPPVCPEGTTGIPPNCVQDACPAGQIGTPPNCVDAKANISRVVVKGPNRVRRNRNVAIQIRITNNGNIAATGVRIQLRGKRLLGNFPVGRVAPNTTRTVRVRTKFRALGRVVARVRVVSNNAGNRTVRKVVRVRR